MQNSKHLTPRARLVKRSITADRPGRPSLSAGFERITPELAPLYLEHNKCNRPLRESRVKRYAKDMTKGKWRTTHQGIAFDSHGNLIDGQHRLYAIIQSGVAVIILVVRNLPPESNDGIDNGFNRGIVDILHYKGMQSNLLEVGVIKWLGYKVKDGVHEMREVSRSEKIDFYLQYKEAITFVVSLFAVGKPLPRMRLSPLLAVFVRAYCTGRYKRKLTHAAEVMLTGVGGEEEKWLIMLRNYLLYLKTVSAEPIRREIYLKTERALHAYLNGEAAVGNLRPTNKELFPLPGEKADKAESKEQSE